MNLKNKVVLITASSTGIGRAMSEAFAREGANVIVNYRKQKEEGEKVLKVLNEIGGDHLLIQADVSKEDEVKKMFSEIEKKYGVVDILMNNAGDAKSIDFLNSTFEEWEYQLHNNFLSAVICSREFLKLKGSENVRKIINTSSIWGFDDKCQPNYMAYGASKAAMNSFTKNMAKMFAPNVLVNAIAPGYVITPHWGDMSEEEMQEEGNAQLIERMIQPEEVAEGAIFLAKNDATTGIILSIDGGIALKTV